MKKWDNQNYQMKLRTFIKTLFGGILAFFGIRPKPQVTFTGTERIGRTALSPVALARVMRTDLAASDKNSASYVGAFVRNEKGELQYMPLNHQAVAARCDELLRLDSDARTQALRQLKAEDPVMASAVLQRMRDLNHAAYGHKSCLS